MTSKVCALCKQPKDLSDFYGNKTARDGRQDVCKACNTIRVRHAHTRRTLSKMSSERLAKYIAERKREIMQAEKELAERGISAARVGEEVVPVFLSAADRLTIKKYLEASHYHCIENHAGLKALKSIEWTQDILRSALDLIERSDPEELNIDLLHDIIRGRTTIHLHVKELK